MVSAKDNVRQLLRERRDGLAADERARLSERVESEVVAYLGPAQRRIGLYAAIRSEVQTEGLFRRLAGLGCELYYPRCQAERTALDFVAVEDPTRLEPGSFGVPEPAGEAAELGSLDLILVPGLAFDRSGARLGYGKGYYDQTLARFDGPRAGLAYCCQVLPRLIAEEHDERVDAVITEDGVIRPGSSTAEAPCLT